LGRSQPLCTEPRRLWLLLPGLADLFNDGVVLTIGVRLIGAFNLGIVRMLGPLVPISLILIFGITAWFLFFAA
jgi:hypothetical protein